MSQVSRRAVLLGGAGVLLAGCGSSGEAGTPGAGRTESGRGGAAGTIVSDLTAGERASWTLTAPANHALDGLPVVISLHGRGGDQSTALRSLGLVEVMDDVVEQDGTPFALATIAAGDHSYYHRRSDGSDAGAVIRTSLLTALGEHGVDLDRVALHGWSMGGYGALLLAGKEKMPVRAVAVASPALFTAAGSTPAGAFDSAADFAAHDVFAHPEWLDGVALRVDCGEQDPFSEATRDFVGRLAQQPAGGFTAGGHDAAYWRTVAPAQLAFLAEHL